MDKKYIRYIQDSVKDKMREFDMIPRNDSGYQVEIMTTSYLINDTHSFPSDHRFHDYDLFMLPLLPQQSLRRDDANVVIQTFYHRWNFLPKNVEFPTHITVRFTNPEYSRDLMNYTKQHKKITKNLLDLLQLLPDQNPDLRVILMFLLRCTRWLEIFCSRKQKRRDRNYNKHLHQFVSDLVIIFLLLLSELYPVDMMPLFTGIKKPTYGIIDRLPNNPIFLELVLTEMCKILRIYIEDIVGTPSHRVRALEKSLYHYFTRQNMTWLSWLTNARNGELCKIISDQGHYMALQSENIRRNHITTIHNTIQKMQNSRKLLKPETFAQERLRIYEDCVLVIPLTQLAQPDAVPQFPENDRVVNIFYHVTYLGVVWCILEDYDLPDVDSDGRFNLKYGNYIEFCRDIVRSVITRVKRSHDVLPNDNIYHVLSQIATSIREIIICRCYLSIKNYKGGIALNRKQKEHMMVLIHFIAFRVLVMYLLPRDPCQYGESKVSDTLPEYAQNIPLPL